MGYIVGVDIGGTFTDCALFDDAGRVTTAKALSTPVDYVDGVVHALANAARKLGFADAGPLLEDTDLFLHACTIADNTLLADRTQKVGLITTAGFRDTLSMMRGLGGRDRSELVDSELVIEVGERVDSSGAVVVALDEDEVRAALGSLVAQGATAVAVSFLWSVLNDSHERLVAAVAKDLYPDLPVLLSSATAPYVGEYERTASCVIAAYIAPTLRGYLSRFSSRLADLGLRSEPLIMQAHGGAIGIDDAIDNPIGSIESGPAAGVIGCAALGQRLGEGNVIVTDMGGTTFKVGVINDGEIARIRRPEFLGHVLLAEKVRVESIGAGGGSIAWVDDELGLLKVGPQGAGSMPGPVCYGFGGTEPTVADSDLLLGYLDPSSVLGGEVPLDPDKAERAMRERVGERLGMSSETVAQGINRIVNAHMADLIRRSTVAQGLDPREFTLFAVGGAAPMHAARYCRDLGIERFVVPRVASVGGAFGLLMSDVSLAFAQAVMLELPVDPASLDRVFDELHVRAMEQMKSYGLSFDAVDQTRSVDVKYRFQTNELTIPLPEGTSALLAADAAGISERFEAMYERSFGPGSTYEGARKDLVSARLELRGRLPRPQFAGAESHRQEGPDGSSDKPVAHRRVWFEETGWVEQTPVLRIDDIATGERLLGPVILEDDVTTIVVDPGYAARRDELANVIVQTVASEAMAR